MRPSSFLIGFQAGTEAGRPLVQAKMQKLADERRAVQRSRELEYSSQQAAAERALRERLQITNQKFSASENDKDRSEAMKRQLLANAATNARAGEQNKLAEDRNDIAEQELAIRKQEFEQKNKSPMERVQEGLEEQLNKRNAAQEELRDVNLAMKLKSATPEQLKQLAQQKSLLESRLTAITSSVESFAASIGKTIDDGNMDGLEKGLSLFADLEPADSWELVKQENQFTGKVTYTTFNRRTGQFGSIPDSLIPRTGEPGGNTGTTTGAGSDSLIKNPSDIPFGGLDNADRLTTTPGVIDATKKSVFALPDSIPAPNYPYGSQTKGPLAK